jgi:DICT domain-containing protein
MGATLGQGWLFGRPRELEPGDGVPPSGRGVTRRRVARARAGTPFDLVADSRRIRRGDKRLLLALSRQLEAEARGLGAETVLLATFQEDKFFTEQSSRRYVEIAECAAFVGALGMGMDPKPATGVRGARLAPDDPLRREWDVVVVGPHFAGAFVARDLGDDGPDSDRRFDFYVTYDRDLVLEAARALMVKIVPDSTLA